jgi:hypothetical protein
MTTRGWRERLSRSPWKSVAAVGCDGYTVMAVRVSSSVVV